MHSCTIGLFIPVYRLFNSAVNTALNNTMFTNNESERTQKWLPGWDTEVNTVPRYGLDGSGFESRRGARSSAPAQTGPM